MKYNNISDFATADIFGIGMPNEAFAQFFVGDSFLKPLTDKNSSLHISNVTFSPAAGIIGTFITLQKTEDRF